MRRAAPKKVWREARRETRREMWREVCEAQQKQHRTVVDREQHKLQRIF
jgi:hypothetical protein